MSIYTNGATWKNETGKYMVARSSKMNASDGGKIYDVLDKVNALEQGMNIKVGGYIPGELQLRNVLTPVIGDAIAFVCDVPLIYPAYTTADQAEFNFVNKAGKNTRALEVVKDDVFGVSDYGFTVVLDNAKGVQLGSYVVVDGARKYKELAADTSAATLATYGFVGQVIGFEKYQYDTVVLVHVVKNTTV